VVVAIYEVPPLEQDEEQPPRPGRWVRWVALVVVLAMVLATPFIYVFSRRGREPRRIRILVPAGQTVRFAPGTVERGDSVRCVGGVGAAIPGPGQGVTGYADGPSGGASIAVDVAPDGTVTVHCGL
jgi:hypothetical protein